ncbi:uncharacterized protein LOC118757380 [Rhagoletis pomonella]|uniref:uncharacterized protein LOC118756962 n=1 Tax=Rhagoletis pomonella TaxID=28610 RepID=UPI0017867F6D|nr:uncharacterized protein LOC118756962 [Rhagoletis pomonella]XP_036347989.1 uncharacterized protein LOC118757380 [Rhagoletis pomonella]
MYLEILVDFRPSIIFPKLLFLIICEQAESGKNRRKRCLLLDQASTSKRSKTSNEPSSTGLTTSGNSAEAVDIATLSNTIFKYFKVIKHLNKTDFHRKRNGVVAECRICKKQLQGSTQITSNFIRHLRLKHVEVLKEYKETKLETPQANGSKQDVFNKLTISYIADLMLPVSAVEKKSFKKLIVCKSKIKINE